MASTLNPRHDDLVAALRLHHQPPGVLFDELDTVTHGLPRVEWPAAATRILWAIHLPATTGAAA